MMAMKDKLSEVYPHTGEEVIKDGLILILSERENHKKIDEFYILILQVGIQGRKKLERRGFQGI